MSQDIPGDAEALDSWSRRFGSVADTIEAASAAIAALQLDDDGQTSLALAEYGRNADYLGENLMTAVPRYRAARDGLAHYAGGIRDAQEKERRARQAVHDAEYDRAFAQPAYDDAWERAHDPDIDETHRQQYIDEYTRAWNRLENARIAAGQGDVDRQNAIIDAENAAKEAAQMIDETVDGDGLNDTWWDDWGKGIYEFLTIANYVILGIVAVLCIIAMVVAIVATGGAAAVALPAFIPALIGILGTVGLGIAITQAAMTGAAMAAGERRLESQVVWDLIGLIPFGRLARGPIESLLRSMHIRPPHGSGTGLGNLPVNRGDSADAGRRLSDAVDVEGSDMARAIQNYLENDVDIYAAIATSAADNATAGQEPALPDLEPNYSAPTGHPTRPGDTASPDYHDRFVTDPPVPDYGTGYTSSGDPDPRPVPDFAGSPYGPLLQPVGPAGPFAPSSGGSDDDD